MAKRENMSNRRGRLGVLLLTAALVCALLSGFAQAAPVEGGSATLEPAAPKPQITIQGNVVVSKGKPTGFYELALCVQTARTVTDNNTGLSAEAEYAALLAEAAETGDRTPVEEFLKTHTVTNYPFQSAAAAVHINLDALTAVTWGSGKPVYADWTGSYPSTTNSTYPRGIDRADPDQPKMFTDLQPILGGGARAVRLDTAKPDEVTNATALIEEAEFDAADAARRTALLTLSANTTTTANVVYEVPTPVVVVRFAYDMNRFTELEVGNPRDQVNAPNESDFWVGLDVNDRLPADAARTALTYLGAQDAGNPTDPYAVSDAQAAGSSVFQSVWYAQNMKSDGTGQEATHFYYYLGAEHCSPSGQASIQVYQEATGTDSSETLYVPKTAGSVVLADRNTAYATPGDPEAAAGGNPNYSFFQNLLQVRTDTLRLDLVNAETYRKPTGGGGITILFYDWDDSLIGSLIVDGGDVRSMVEEYVEENLVHPDLRPSTALKAMGGKLPDGGNYTTADQLAYQTLTNSLARDYTYRGKYAYTVGGDDATLGVTDGEDYPLTNKLDYVFTKRVNTSASYSVSDVTGTHTETYVLPHKVTDADMVDAALYPYAYGWAVVEDPSSKNQRDWKVMNDATKLEDTWTTIGVGELSNVEPDYYDNGAADQTLPTALGAATYQAPAFLADEDPYWVDHVNEAPQPGMDYTNKYAYSLNSNGSESYFRFADFSDIDAELARYTKKNGTPKDTLIVKATYEPGESLLEGYSYRLAETPYYNKLNSYASTKGAAYSVEIVMERSDDSLGQLRGVSRVRVPTLRQDTTADNKWLEDDRIPDHDADNASLDVAKDKSQTAYVQAQMIDGDTVTATLSLSARHNKVDFFLIEGYGKNFVAGAQRSLSNFARASSMQVVDNYNYYSTDSDTKDLFLDIQSYTDKDGSHGFVLYGTLNCMMEQATRYARGELDSDGVAQYIDRMNLQDANLRSNASGAQPSATTATVMRDRICRAAIECIAHRGDPDYWNNDKDCAQLTYHQVQYYILERVLLDPVTAEDSAHKLGWCHLHVACAETVSNKPKNWTELIEKAKNNDIDAITALLLDELQTMTRLRANLNGGQYTDRDLLAEDIVKAVQAGCESWNDIQYYLIHRAKPTTDEEKAEANARYWWYDGSTSNPAPTDLPALITAVKTASEPPLNPPPDGDTSLRTSKLYGVKAIVDDNADELGEAITSQWRRLTHNLVADADERGAPIRFTTYEQFISALADALAKRPTITGADRDSWNTLQRLILEAAADPDEPSTTDYYWYDGGRRITSLAELIVAAQEKQAGDSSLWDSLTQTMFTSFADPTKDAFWYFADAFEMTRFLDFTTETDYNAFLKIFLDWVATPGADLGNTLNTTWGELQYMIAHEGALDTTIARNEYYGGFYWWQGGVTTPPDYDLSTAQGILDNAAMAAFSSKFNGNAGAWNSLTQEALDVLNLRYLTDADAADWGFDNLTETPKPNGNTTVDADHNTRDAMPKLTTAQFITAMEGMVTSYRDAQVAAGNGHGHDLPPAMNAYEMQYGVINNGEYRSQTEMPSVTVGTATKPNGYWWLTVADAPNPWKPSKPEVTAPAEWTDFLAKLAANPDASTMTADDFKSVKVSINGSKETYPAKKTLAGAKRKLGIAAAGIVAAGGKIEDLTWYEIEYVMTTETYVPHIQATAHSQKDTWNTWAPEWVIQKWDPDYEP